MTMQFTSPYPTIRLLAAALLVAGLSGCLSGGGGSSRSAPPPPAAGTTEQNPLIRATAQGQVQGTDAEVYYAFRGIPFAKPPVGALRWAAPQTADTWTGVRDATEYGSDCVQSNGSGSEDCLYLNVFTPKTPGPHPVMVWIHGGAFVFGSGGGTYIPTRLVSHDTVVVTINYRLGRFGFLAHPGLSAEVTPNASGNYGIMDQQLALKWVKDNIARFGGDARNVTIFGESAGGLSVLTHLVSPASKDLFDKAIVQSGSYSNTQTSMAIAQTAGDTFATQVGCDREDLADEVSCLRARTVAQILAFPPASVTPTLHPQILPASVLPSLQAGNFNKVPVITGTNTEEFSYFLATTPEITAENYATRMPGFGGSLAATILGLYPLANYAKPSGAVVAAFTDQAFACNASSQANAIRASNTSPSFVYEFADRNAPPIIPIPAWLDAGASHAFEIQYLFGSDEGFATRATADQVTLANVMTRAWTNFARYGDPSATDGTFSWPAYNPANGFMVSFVPPQPQAYTGLQFRAAHRCSFWAP
jgi:para-nitrobenzyl esterase